jgi:hypothetical protein
VTQESDGGYCAECLTESIFTQGETWDELRANVKEAVDAFYFDGPAILTSDSCLLSLATSLPNPHSSDPS